VFGLSEINWGIIPAGVVSRDLAAMIGYREALRFIMTGATFTGADAAAMGLVNSAVPRAALRDAVTALAGELLTKNTETLRTAKESFRHCHDMPWEQAREYLYAKLDQMRFRELERDGSVGRDRALEQFVAKRFRPGLSAFSRDDDNGARL
jgi:trans-feruloyl-CoA hydratase/vanillin synthase